jgi:hypothetical protein
MSTVQMMKRWTIMFIAGIVVLMIAVLGFSRNADLRERCDKLGGFYDYKNTICWHDGGPEVLGWTR